MAPINLSGEEKACILSWKTENVSTKEISRCTGRSESTIQRLVATALGLPSNVVPSRKSVPGRPRKTSKFTKTSALFIFITLILNICKHSHYVCVFSLGGDGRSILFADTVYNSNIFWQFLY